MTLLYDDTQLLLAVDLREDDSSLDEALTSLSAAVITQLALKAKARAYQARIDRGLAAAANQGASLDELAAAAGIGPDEVLARLRATPGGLIEPVTSRRLRLEPPTRVAEVPVSADPVAAQRKPRRWWQG